jgi:hypothetical protein
MTDLNNLYRIVNKIQAVQIGGAVNLIAYPSPDEVRHPKGGGWGGDSSHILIRKPGSVKILHTNSFRYTPNRLREHPKTIQPKILAYDIPMPDICVVCNQPANTTGVIECLSHKFTHSNKLTVEGSNTQRIWESLENDRYWFTFPVCDEHKFNFHQHANIGYSGHGNKIEFIVLNNKAWCEKFLRMNDVISATYKDKSYRNKGLAFDSMIAIGGFLVLGFILSHSGWELLGIIPGLVLIVAGIILKKKNPPENLLANQKIDDN